MVELPLLMSARRGAHMPTPSIQHSLEAPIQTIGQEIKNTHIGMEYVKKYIDKNQRRHRKKKLMHSCVYLQKVRPMP